MYFSRFILLAILFFGLFHTAQALIPNQNLNQLLLSGTKQEVGSAVEEVISILKKHEDFHPSYVNKKKEQDFTQLLEGLEGSEEQKNQALINISEAYLFSARKEHQEMVFLNPFERFASFSVISNFDVLFEHLSEDQKASKMLREYYIALLLSSYTGFFSQEGRALHIMSLYKYRETFVFLNQIPSILKKTFHLSLGNQFNRTSEKAIKTGNKSYPFLKDHFENIEGFRGFFEQMKKQKQVIISSFEKLEWVQRDLKKHYDRNPSVGFAYGEIAVALGSRDKGRPYIIKAAGKGYAPAIEYVIDDQNMLSLLSEYERNSMVSKYLSSKEIGLMKKMKETWKLFVAQSNEGSNVLESFSKGIGSVQESCRLIFASQKAN